MHSHLVKLSLVSDARHKGHYMTKKSFNARAQVQDPYSNHSAIDSIQQAHQKYHTWHANPQFLPFWMEWLWNICWWWRWWP